MAIEQQNLENLSFDELGIMLAHVRLGESHLRKYLNREQMKKLLDLAPLKQHQIDNIKSDRAERSGHIALVFNTLITGSFGAWLGFSGFMRLRLDSLQALAGITGFAMFTSGCVGYYTFKLTNTNAKRAVMTQRLHNLQLKILRMIVAKRRAEVESMISYLSRCLTRLDEEGVLSAEHRQRYTFDSNEAITAWLNDLYQILQAKSEAIRSEGLYQFYWNRLNEISESLKGLFSKNLAISGEQTDAAAEAPPRKRFIRKFWGIKKPTASTSSTRVLTDPTIPAPRIEIKQRSWLRDNVVALFVGLAPTLMGGFSSMFVFLSGAPSVASDFGLTGLEAFLRHPVSQVFEFAIAVALTIYYGFSHIYNNRKSYARSHELEKTRKMIANEESLLIELNTKYNTMEKARDQIRFIFDTYEALAIFSEYSLAKQREINEHLRTIKLLKAQAVKATSKRQADKTKSKKA